MKLCLPSCSKSSLRVNWINLALCLALLLAPITMMGQDLTFSYTDPTGDQAGATDLTRMVVVYDSVTGKYKITFTSTAASPFNGSFRVNVNLFNPSRLPSHSFFQDAVNDYALTLPQTKLVLTGTSPALTFWQAGDVVAANDAAGLGNPPGATAFHTGVLDLPVVQIFPFGEDSLSQAPGTAKATITSLTPQGALEGISDDVQILLETHVLSAGQANALMAKLGAAMSSLNRSNKNSACGQLGAFINQVNAFQSAGILTVDQAQELIAAAEAVRAKIPCA